MIKDEKGVNSFIRELKERFPPFEYEQPTVVRFFMLSYDQTLEDFLPDSTAWLIAALHAKGAHMIASFVPGCIFFQAEAKENRSKQAIENWGNYLAGLFAGECKFVICVVREYSNTGAPIFGIFPTKEREEKFDDLVQWVIERFKIL
jgi:hypothetical protein